LSETLAWLGRYRRLSQDYEVLAQTSEAFIYAAMLCTGQKIQREKEGLESELKVKNNSAQVI
jgi:hypothetical protein